VSVFELEVKYEFELDEFELEPRRFIYTTFTQHLHYYGIVLVGMTDQQREGHHVWVDGECF
jgi:hypothetical protein